MEKVHELFGDKLVGAFPAEAMALAGLDLEFVRPSGPDQRIEEIHGVLQMHIVVGRAVDDEQFGLELVRRGQRRAGQVAGRVGRAATPAVKTSGACVSA